MLDKEQFVFRSRFVLRMMTGVVMMSVDVEIKITMSSDRAMRQQEALAEKRERCRVCDKIPASIQIPGR